MISSVGLWASFEPFLPKSDMMFFQKMCSYVWQFLAIFGHFGTIKHLKRLKYTNCNYWVPETSEILVSREFSRIFFIFNSRSRSRAVSNSLSLLEKEWRDFIFHFSLLKKVKAIRVSLFFLEKKEWNQVQGITSPLSLFWIVFPTIVKSQVSTSLKILAKFQFQNLD